MIKFFTSRNKIARASVTVFVTLILVPSIFFVGFLDDIARMKLYCNQAVLAADDYGEDILTEYDALLEELYGLFAITQSEEGIKALDTITSYAGSSFDPTKNELNSLNTVTGDMIRNAVNGEIDPETWHDFASELEKNESAATYKGLMPYKDLNPTFEKTFVESSSLREEDIFETQMGDFMRYRIFQTLYNADGTEIGDLTSVLSAVEDSEKDNEYLEKKSELTDVLQEFLDASRVYYLILKDIDYYKDYLDVVNDKYTDVIAKYKNAYELSGNNSFETYVDSIGMTVVCYPDRMASDYDYLMSYDDNDEDEYTYNYDRIISELQEYYNAVINAKRNHTAYPDQDAYGSDLYYMKLVNYCNKNQSSSSESLIFNKANFPSINDFHYSDYELYLNYLVADLMNTAGKGGSVYAKSYIESATGDDWYYKFSKSNLTEADCNGNTDLTGVDNISDFWTDNSPAEYITAYDLWNLNTLPSKSYILISVANVVANKCNAVNSAVNDCSEALSNASEEVQEADKDELEEIKDLTSNPNLYIELANDVYDKGYENNSKMDNWLVSDGAEDKIYDILSNEILGPHSENDKSWDEIYSEYKLDETITRNDYVDYKDNSEYANLYNKLDEAFGTSTAKNEKLKEQAQTQQDEADKMSSQATTEINNDADEVNNMNLRNIPSFLTSSDSGSSTINKTYYISQSNVTERISGIKDFAKTLNFSDDDLGMGNTATHLLLKTYLLQYDMNMFSCRVTNVKNEKDADGNEIKEKSLTGYELASNINYLYKGELEYLIGGYTDSKDNLNYTRNYIVAFRFMMNTVSSYKIKEVNDAIKDASDAVKEVPYVGVVLSILVDIALRAGFAAAESAADWKMLKDGESVVVFKTKVEQSSCWETLKGIAGYTKTESTGTGSTDEEDSTLKLNYKQYVMVMIFFFTSSQTLVKRTQNLIELNVNNVQSKISSDAELTESNFKFTMDKAYTAVEAKCTIDCNFIIMNDSFANVMFTDDSSRDYFSSTFSKSKFSYTVIRGY